MPRSRSHSSEYQKRLAKARAAGFKSEREYKLARSVAKLKKGEALPPRELIANETLQVRPPTGDALLEACEDFSEYRARRDVAKLPEDPTRAQLEAYWRAFVRPFNRGHRSLHTYRGADRTSLKHWFVDVMGYMTPNEFDARYRNR